MAKYKNIDKKIDPSTLSAAGQKYYSENMTNTGSGKGDAPRSCFSSNYRDNYDFIFRKGNKSKK